MNNILLNSFAMLLVVLFQLYTVISESNLIQDSNKENRDPNTHVSGNRVVTFESFYASYETELNCIRSAIRLFENVTIKSILTNLP